MNLPKQLMTLTAPEVRVDLLLLTRAYGSLAFRVLSIMEQAASEGRNISATSTHLIALPSDADLDVILDGASRVLIPKNEDRFEL